MSTNSQLTHFSHSGKKKSKFELRKHFERTVRKVHSTKANSMFLTKKSNMVNVIFLHSLQIICFYSKTKTKPLKNATLSRYASVAWFRVGTIQRFPVPAGSICAADCRRRHFLPTWKLAYTWGALLCTGYRLSAFTEDHFRFIFCKFMIIESRTMASSDEEEQLGQDSDGESELSDGQVSSS